MNDLLGNLGWGGSLAQEQSAQQNLLQQYLLQQQYQPNFCIHGSGCPTCLETAKKTEEARKERAEIIKQKILAYDLRCKKYMENFWKG